MHSQLLVQLKVSPSFSSKLNNNIQYNNLLIVLNHTAIVVVKLEEWTIVLIISEIKVFFQLNLGINTWASYPYAGIQQQCKTATGLFKIARYVNITDCTTLANALTKQPISVAVDGNNFQFYTSGVFYNCSTNLSLAVLLVGMTDAFWVLKNSWGPTWG
jgi:hypothetical protein